LFARAEHRRWRLDNCGTAAVEFAVIAPPFVALLIGIVVFGWVMNCTSSLRLALEASGRALEINPSLSSSDLTAIAKAELTSLGDPNVTVTLAADTSVAGVTMNRVTGNYNVDLHLPFMPVQHISFQSSVDVPTTVS
jgi:Flp pilus assembly protein TadG